MVMKKNCYVLCSMTCIYGDRYYSLRLLSDPFSLNRTVIEKS